MYGPCQERENETERLSWSLAEFYPVWLDDTEEAKKQNNKDFSNLKLHILRHIKKCQPEEGLSKNQPRKGHLCLGGKNSLLGHTL